jgi:hypothetical protein
MTSGPPSVAVATTPLLGTDVVSSPAADEEAGNSDRTLEELRAEEARLEAEIALYTKLNRLNEEREEVRKRIKEMEERQS